MTALRNSILLFSQQYPHSFKLTWNSQVLALQDVNNGYFAAASLSVDGFVCAYIRLLGAY